jgi:hypothetical protein
MKLAGFFLLFAGWSILVVAIAILPSQATRAIFVVAGLLVEILGLILVARFHRQPTGDRA